MRKRTGTVCTYIHSLKNVCYTAIIEFFRNLTAHEDPSRISLTLATLYGTTFRMLSRENTFKSVGPFSLKPHLWKPYNGFPRCPFLAALAQLSLPVAVWSILAAVLLSRVGKETRFDGCFDPSSLKDFRLLETIVTCEPRLWDYGSGRKSEKKLSSARWH
jgi:hypothetical protein